MTTHSNPASILILAQSSDRWFSSPETIAELLRLEGINDLDTAWLEQATPQKITGRSLIIVGSADPAPQTVDLLLEHVKDGGGLICFAPGEAFAARLGIRHQLRGSLHSRVLVPLEGFPDSPLPTRGWAQHYTLEATDANVIAHLCDAQGHPLGAPAVVEMGYGRGKIIVVAYDLAMSTYLLRQGDPLMAGSRASGYERMRPLDLFWGWSDLQAERVPAADLQCHLLRELTQRAWSPESALPWLWYFPDNAETMLVMTSDDDWSKREEFEQLITACERYDARLTFYLVERESVMDRRWLEDLARRGFDFSVHPDLPPPTGADWESRLRRHVQQFGDRYGRAPSPSVRNHCITWSGYLDGVRVESACGFTFDCNYFSMNGRIYLSSAGLPLPFADPRGEVLPVFQLPSQFSDETTLGGQGFTWSLNLTPEQGFDLITDLMRANAADWHSVMCINAHPVSFATYSAPMWEPVMAFAQEKGIRIWDVNRFSRFWHARRQTRLRPVPRGQTSLDVIPQTNGVMGLTALIPTNPTEASGATRRVNGRLYRVCRV